MFVRMFLFTYIVLLLVFGTLRAHQTGINIHRQHHNRESSLGRNLNHPLENNRLKPNYNDHKSREGRKNVYTNEPIPLEVHSPREDPKLYYQSEAYLRQLSGLNVNYEVSQIYPGREVIRADKNTGNFDIKKFLRSGPENCIKCPLDKTLVAKIGADRVKLLSHRIKMCSSRKSPRNIHFIQTDGPKVGSLLKKGSYVIIGRIMQKNETLQHCKFHVHVIIQSCPTPKYLVSNCDNQKHCNFTCRDPKKELQGKPSLFCRHDNSWTGKIPTCRIRRSCNVLPPPEQGRIHCKGATTSTGLVEGSKCRLRCSKGWRWFPRAVAVCRHGSWTNSLKCQKNKVY